MQQATWAAITAAETASQLVLGALYCSLHALAKKHVEWVGFGIACWGLGVATCSLPIVGSADATSARLAAMIFTAGVTVAVSLIAFGLAWMARSNGLRRIGWAAAAIGAAWQLVLGYFNPFVRMPAAAPGPFGSRSAELAVGWVFLLFLAVVITLATLAFVKVGTVDRVERRVIVVAVGVLVVGCLFDALTGPWTLRPPIAMPHAATAFALMLAVALLLRYRELCRGARKGERQLQQSLEELATAQASLERVQRELGAKKQLAVVGELAAAIAHEVRNPLAIIVNAAAGLRRPTLGSEDRTTLLSILDEETARLNRLVTDLLRFARPVIIKRSSVSIVELARRVEGRLEDKHRLSVSVPDHPRLKVVQADANLLRLVFENLVSNAFQAMPDGGVVQIVVSEDAQDDVRFVRIDIVDEGQGMDEQVLARATDPFYTTRPSGTGLGLPIVQRIVEAHGGRLEIESGVGRGTKVSLFLPSLPPPGETSVEVDEAANGMRA